MNRVVQIVLPILLLLLLFFVPSSIVGLIMHYSSPLPSSSSSTAYFIMLCAFTILIWPIFFARIGTHFINRYNLKHIAFKGSVIVLSIIAVIHEMHMMFLGSHPSVWSYVLRMACIDFYRLIPGSFDALDVFFLLIILGMALVVLIAAYCAVFYKTSKTNSKDTYTE